MRLGGMVMAALLALPGLAVAQSNPVVGAGAAQLHGQRPDMRQDLHNAPGTPMGTGGHLTPNAPQTRTQALRQRSSAEARQAAARQARRAAQQRGEASAGQAARLQRTGTGTAAARSPDSMAAHEARMAEARRRQAEAAERAARAQPGVR
jgi:hypothetical protein